MSDCHWCGSRIIFNASGEEVFCSGSCEESHTKSVVVGPEFHVLMKKIMDEYHEALAALADGDADDES